MANSRLEDARSTILTKLRLITTANGYRNTVANVVPAIRFAESITAFPEIGVEFGDSTIAPLDSARTVYDEITEVFVAGFVSADAETADDPENIAKLFDSLESLVHDMKILITKELLTAFVNGTNSWNVELAENKLTFSRDRIGQGQRSVGIVVTQFNIRIRNQDNTFS
jgi:hypothetical protein